MSDGAAHRCWVVRVVLSIEGVSIDWESWMRDLALDNGAGVGGQGAAGAHAAEAGKTAAGHRRVEVRLHEQTLLFQPQTRLHEGPLHLGVVTWDKPRRGRGQELLLLCDVQIRLLQGDFTGGLSGESGGGRRTGLGPGVEEDWGLLVVAVGGGQRVRGGPFSLCAAPASAAPRH